MPMLYPNFLQNARVYAEAESMWVQILDKILEQIGRGDWEVPWFHVPPGLRDGNPICSAVSRSLRRGVRVIQHEAEGVAPEFTFWWDSSGDAEPIAELVIALATTDSNVRLAAQFMRVWMETGALEVTAVRPLDE